MEFKHFDEQELPNSGLYWFVVDRMAYEDDEDEFGGARLWSGKIERVLIPGELLVFINGRYNITSLNEEMFGALDDGAAVTAFCEFKAPRLPKKHTLKVDCAIC